MSSSCKETAESLVERASGVILREGVDNWPWKPFSDPCEADQRDDKQHHFLAKFSHAKSYEDKLEAAKKILELGGVQWRGGRIKLPSNPYRVYGQRGKLYRYGGVEEFAKTFREAVPGWDDDRPNWDAVSQILVSRGAVPGLGLKDLTLIDIRVLLAAHTVRVDGGQRPTQALNVGDGPSRLGVTEATNRWVFDGADWDISFGGKSALLNDVDGCHYYAWILRSQDSSRPLSALDLYHTRHGDGRYASSAKNSTSNPFTDKQYEKQVRLRVAELQGIISEAERAGDESEARLHQEELDFLLGNLKQGRGLGDRVSGSSSDFDKAINTVRKRLETVRQTLRIKGLDALALHLEQAISKDLSHISYRPQPAVMWEVSIKPSA